MTRAVTFGQAPAGPTHVHIDDKYCSTKHCQVTVDDAGQFHVADLGSTNGTYLDRNGTCIRVYGPTRLLPGDKVRIGRTTLPWEAR